MCRPVDGSREAACPGGHIGPPLHNAGNVPEITESGVENEHFPSGAGRSPPPTGGAEQGGLRRGAPRVWLPPAKFRNGIWGVSHRHRLLRKEEKATSITRASGAQRSVCGAVARDGWESRQRSSPKGSSTSGNPSVTAFGRASSLCTREPLGTGDADRRNQRPKFWDKIWLAVATP